MQKRLHTIWLAVFLLLLHSTVSVAYTAELKIEKTLTKADGLISNNVLAIFQDSHGAMWFGTTNGLTRYDGENFRTFTTEDGLAQDTIGLIFEDQRGMLWFGDGVLVNDLKREKTMDMSWMETPLSELDLTPHDEIPAGTMKPIRPKGVSRYDGDAFRIFTTFSDDLVNDNVKDIFEDEMGTLWFVTGFGVSRYDGTEFHNFSIDGPMGMNILPEAWKQVRTIAQDTAGNLWFGSYAGIIYYNAQTSRLRYFGVDPDFSPFQEMGQAQTAHITDLQFDAKENLWMSRDDTDEESSGVRRFDGKKLTIFPQSDALPMNSVNNITKDSGGNLWFTGVKKLPAKMHETENSISMTFPEVESGVSVYNGERFQNFNTDDGLPSNRIWSVFEDSRGKLWFATDAGVAIGVYLPSEK
ncbi:hypothetical protein C6500_21145 [Candidatus Poribacteria bacterium]|nr:MAG: hypothetical protein C6500_21145 [Candidatus Poribacteria bacterium]